jgi:hypothetical protein
MPGRPRGLVHGHLLRNLQLPAISEVFGNSVGPEGLVPILVFRPQAMARGDEERQNARGQLLKVAEELQVAQASRAVASRSVFSVDQISALKAQQALAEFNLRDGLTADAAATLGQALEVAKSRL